LSRSTKLNRYTSFIPLISVLLIVMLGISPVYLIIAGAVLGLFYFYLIKR
jgi:chromate transporter